MEMIIDVHSGPVTALLVVGKKIIAGVGDFLHVYSASGGPELHVERCLPCCNIHGLRKETPSAGSQSVKLCVYGERCARIVNYSDNTNRFQFEADGVGFDDWIWDAAWLKGEPVSQIALALGHNVVLLWDWKRNAILERVACEESCILYCALFIGDHWSDLILAAGTVFNQVVLWSPGGQHSDRNVAKVLHRICGHQGVIFSIDFHSELSVICSVSDDRSIRVWKLTILDKDWSNVQSSMLHVLYGHSARVWMVKILANKLVSIGEDATLCIWNHDGDVLKKFRGHKGKSIWSLAISDNEDFVVTGGGDHSVRLWQLQTDESNNDTGYTTSLMIPRDITISDEDFPRLVLLQSFDVALIMTNNGVLHSYNINQQSWSMVMADSNFRSYCVMSVSPNGAFISLGSIGGILKVIWRRDFANYETHELQVYKGKVHSVLWLDDASLLTTGPDGLAILWTVSVSRMSVIIKRCSSYLLPYCKQRWFSAASLVTLESLLICGDRGGTVHVYHVEEGENSEELVHPVKSFPKLHGKAGVTDIRFHDNHVYTAGRDGQYRQYNIENGCLRLLNSCRGFKGLEWIDQLHFTEDALCIYGFCASNFVIWSVNQNQKILEIDCGGGHRSWDCKIENGTARFIYLKSKDVGLCERMVKSCQVILKAGLHGREFTSIKHLASKRLSGTAVDLCVSASEDNSLNVMAIYNSNEKPPVIKVLKVLQGHISSIRALAVCHCYDENNIKLLFSAGGRAQINVWRLRLSDSHNDSNLKTKIVDRSLSDIKKGDNRHFDKPQILENSSNEDASIPGISLDTQADYNPHDVVTSNNTSMKSDFHCTHELIAMHMLCGNSRRRRKPWKQHVDKPSPETRYMDLSVIGSNDDARLPMGHYIIGAAGSDGYIRVFGFIEDKRQFHLLAQSATNSHCILKVSCFVHNSQPPSVILLSASTDGRVRMWNITDCVTRLGDIVHQKREDSEIRNIRTNVATEYGLDTDECDIDKTSREYVNPSFPNDEPASDTTRKLKTEILEDSTCNEMVETDYNSKTEEDSGRYRDRIVSEDTDCRSMASGQSHHVTSGAGDLGRPCHLDPIVSKVVAMMPFYSLTTHQSGINCLSVHRMKDSRYLLVTGGDDNAVNALIFSVDHEHATTGLDNAVLGIQTFASGKKVDAHSAQITGAHVLCDQLLVTASIDQRVCIWRLILEDNDGIKFELACCKFVNVADISSLAVWNSDSESEHRLAVCGEGVAVLKLTGFL